MDFFYKWLIVSSQLTAVAPIPPANSTVCSFIPLNDSRPHILT
jgi:hypothetical protein